MSISKRYSIVGSLALLILLTPAEAAARSSQGGAGSTSTRGKVLRRAERFLKRVDKLIDIIRTPEQSVTLADLRDLLSSRAVIEQPVWTEGEMATGNAAEIKGPVLGMVVFLNAEQRGALASGAPLTDEQKKFRESDPVAYIQIHLGDSVKQARPRIMNVLAEALARRLGRDPDETPDNVAPSAELSEARGWVATWRFRNGRAIDLWHRWYGHKYVMNIYFSND